MHTLKWTLTVLTICGCLPPPLWTSPLKKLLYKFYTIFVWITVHAILSCQMLDIILIVDNQDDFIDNFYITAGVFISSCKINILLMNRANILVAIDNLQREPFLATNAKELEIRTKFEQIIERNAIIYSVLLIFNVTCIYVRSIFTDFGKQKLTFRAWVPYNYSSLLLFAFTYIYEQVSIQYSVFVNIACDSLFTGLLIHIYCQFEILEHRLESIKENESYMVKRCARHHSLIYRFAKMVNKEFKAVVFSQFWLSTIMLCFTLYELTQEELESKVGEMVILVCSMFTQIFYYCWYSNEVKLKSLEFSDTIFKSNWISWNNNVRKIVLMLMKRAAEPIEFTSISVVSMNLDSFMALLKTSYSAYNVLQQSQV